LLENYGMSISAYKGFNLMPFLPVPGFPARGHQPGEGDAGIGITSDWPRDLRSSGELAE